MPRESAFHSINEVKKPPKDRVYHNNSTCPSGRDIPRHERREGSNNYRRCENCQKLNSQGR